MAVDTSIREAIASICRVAPDEKRGRFAVDGIVPRVVAYPESAEDVRVIVKIAAEHNLAVIPCGGGTQMGLGNIPRAADIVLRTGGMDRVLEYEPADLVVTVEAGIRLDELQRRLAGHGQFLALDPPLADRATIGGIIATNASGPLRLRHGTVRDLLIGVKVAGADGAITKGGGKVVKNVTGYDMCKLYTGSLGSLGVIVEASFKLAPLPKLESTVLAWFTELGLACQAARAIYKSALPIRACELLSPPAADAIGQSTSYMLAVRIGGGQAAVERQQRDVLAMCSSAESAQATDGNDVWRAIQDFGRERYEAIAKLSSQPSRTGQLLGILPREATFVSHVLSGVTYVFGAEAEAAAQAARDLGGYAVLEACPLETKRRLDVWGPVGADFRLMERIKREFDPHGILNPGRYVGGL
ncbi:MAG TPA: FAD-binding oxidoreductase [Chloroflexota bacterium]|nr:FAD-binding oxidoreductase [Chloroflexota bacterium]